MDSSLSPFGLDDVVSIVARRFGVSAAQLCSTSRDGRVSNARLVAAYIARVELELSTATIGRRLGFHWSMVGYACERIEDLRDIPLLDRMLDEIVDDLRRPRLAAPESELEKCA